MKQKLFIFLALIFLFILLIGLNAASYVQKEKIPDSENNPNRSTYNVGATGTRAFYDLLAETGKKVIRWQEPFPNSGNFRNEKFSTFVIIGKTRREFEPREIDAILEWVSAGGKLVLIDRDPYSDLISANSNWNISRTGADDSPLTIDSSDQTQMVGKSEAVKPVQPTIFTTQVNAVQPSKFAPSISISRSNVDGEDTLEEPQVETEAPLQADVEDNSEKVIDNLEPGFGSGNKKVDELFKTPVPTPIDPVNDPHPTLNTPTVATETLATAPVIHLANEKKNLLVDFPYGDGQIVFLSDPYIVANGGIKLVDNAQLATNVVTSRRGIIAFDEYHQGFGRNENRLIEYFAGTPVVAMFLQLFLIVGLIFYSQSRRFARALPDNDPDRLSKLEYVSAMAQVQERTRAFDLAIENIYSDFRRRVSRLFNVDNHNSTRKELAEKIAERLNKDANDIEDLMYKCEDIMHGESTNKKEVIQLTRRLREIEEELGLRRGTNRKGKK